MQEQDILEALKEMIKANIEKFKPGYAIDETGNVINVNAKNNTQSLKELEPLYNEYKDCDAYAKAVSNFNHIYTNILTVDAMNKYANNELKFPFKIYLPFIDVYFIYDKIKDNQLIVEKYKKTKLKCNKINPYTDYVKKSSYIELAMKLYKKLDDETKKDILGLVHFTIRDAEIIDNPNLYNTMYLKELADVNDVSLDDADIIAELNKELNNDNKF